MALALKTLSKEVCWGYIHVELNVMATNKAGGDSVHFLLQYKRLSQM